MDGAELGRLLRAVAAGEVKVEEATQRLTRLPFSDIDGARIDHHRFLRQGLPEVVFAAGKTDSQLETIADHLLAEDAPVLFTRVRGAAAERLQARHADLTHDPLAATLSRAGRPAPSGRGDVLIVTAGTSDLPVAREARVTLELMGCTVDQLDDVGVAGLHRILPEIDRLQRATLTIVVAGMEGALASVVGGLARGPVIAVPTSVGYGAALGGLTPALAMLTGCAAGVTVVNVDNGFGAAAAALRMLEVFVPRGQEASS